MKISIVNFSSSRGGAAIAAYQQFLIAKTLYNSDVELLVAERDHSALDGNISYPPRVTYFTHLLKRIFSFGLVYFFQKITKVKCSLNLFSSTHVVKQLLKKEQDVIHYHWINNETISLSDILKISLLKPSAKIIFTLHDEWLLSGVVHYPTNNAETPLYLFFSFFDNIYKHYKKSIIRHLVKGSVTFTMPSKYMLKQFKEHELFRYSDARVIPNVIDTETFKPTKCSDIRYDVLGNSDKKIVLFGAAGGKSYLKGTDLLESAIEEFTPDFKGSFVFVTFGGKSNQKTRLSGIEIFNFGHVSNKDDLAKIYSMADVTIVPSRIEAFGQVAAESLACGTPVIGFAGTGVADIIEHGISGYLVEQFDTEQLATSIKKILSLPESDRTGMGLKGREFVTKNFSPPKLQKLWHETYESLK